MCWGVSAWVCHLRSPQEWAWRSRGAMPSATKWLPAHDGRSLPFVPAQLHDCRAQFYCHSGFSHHLISLPPPLFFSFFFLH